MRRFSSDTLVRALGLAGFTVYRQTGEATILERGLRAVTVRSCAVLESEVLMDLRRMAGLSWLELDAALGAMTDRETDAGGASTAAQASSVAQDRPDRAAHRSTHGLARCMGTPSEPLQFADVVEAPRGRPGS
jgi:hypothetical protein